jgi:hypothetical protein
MTIASSILAPVSIKRVTVAVERVAALSAEERYAYYLLGHLFNELMFLQKLLHFAIPKHADARPVRQLPEYGQLFFVARLAVGKMWEAKLALERSEMSKVLRTSFLPLVPEQADRLQLWCRRVSKSRWVERLRNAHSFHYPKFAQWSSLLQPDPSWEDDHIFTGSQSGNVYYAGSDSIAQNWMFGQLSETDPRNAVDPMVSELIALLGGANDAVEEVLGAFIVERLSPNQAADLGTVDTVLFEHVELPFWTNMPAKAPTT